MSQKQCFCFHETDTSRILTQFINKYNVFIAFRAFNDRRGTVDSLVKGGWRESRGGQSAKSPQAGLKPGQAELTDHAWLLITQPNSELVCF